MGIRDDLASFERCPLHNTIYFPDRGEECPDCEEEDVRRKESQPDKKVGQV